MEWKTEMVSKKVDWFRKKSTIATTRKEGRSMRPTYKQTAAAITRRFQQDMRETNVLFAGFDGGNATAVLWVGDEYRQITSYIGTGDVSSYTSFGGDAGGGFRPGDHVLIDEVETWFVGDLARTQCQDASTQKGNDARYYLGHTLRLFKTMIAAYVAEKNPGVFQHSIRVKVVTSVPIKLYRSDPALGLHVAESYVGDYWYRYINHTGEHTVHLLIEAAQTGMEGLSPLIAFGEKGKPQGFIDFGGGSIDIGCVDEKKTPLYEKCQSLMEWGTERVVELVSGQFRAVHGRLLDQAEQGKVLPAYQAGNDLVIYEQGEQVIPVTQMTDIVGGVNQQIDSFLKTWWGKRPGNNLASVRLIGGGATIFQPTLYAGEIIIPPHPHAENARANAALAERLETRQAWKVVRGAV